MDKVRRQAQNFRNTNKLCADSYSKETWPIFYGKYLFCLNASAPKLPMADYKFIEKPSCLWKFYQFFPLEYLILMSVFCHENQCQVFFFRFRFRLILIICKLITSRFGTMLIISLQMQNIFLINIATNSGVSKSRPYLCGAINHPEICPWRVGGGGSWPRWQPFYSYVPDLLGNFLQLFFSLFIRLIAPESYNFDHI